MNSNDEFVLRYIAMRDSRGGSTGLCERLPTAPAIYAWFRTIRIPFNHGPTEFVASITSAIEAPAAPLWTSKLGPMHSATLESRSSLSTSKESRLEESSLSEDFRKHTSRIIEAAAVLQAPLYVGKANDLQRRVRQHLEPMSELSVRFRDAGIRINDCTLAYAILESSDPRESSWVDDQSVLTLIEEIITRICRPGFVARHG